MYIYSYFVTLTTKINHKKHTGKTHQIRLQFLALSLSIVGDTLYHQTEQNKLIENNDASSYGYSTRLHICVLIW